MNKNFIVFLLLGVAAVFGLYSIFQPEADQATSSQVSKPTVKPIDASPATKTVVQTKPSRPTSKPTSSTQVEDAVETKTPAPVSEPTTQATAETSNRAIVEAQSKPMLKSFELSIKNNHLSSGPALIEVHQGEHLALNFYSDADHELHLHGYDLTLDLVAGETRQLNFIAIHSGRFGYELHGHGGGHSDLGAIAVMPR